jgi:RNA polymerase sigma-70 factor, ECF subfamily
MDSATDIELLERARQGRADAFGALVRRHDRYLYRVARSILRDHQEAEDVVQQTYLEGVHENRRLSGGSEPTNMADADRAQ